MPWWKDAQPVSRRLLPGLSGPLLLTACLALALPATGDDGRVHLQRSWTDDTGG